MAKFLLIAASVLALVAAEPPSPRQYLPPSAGGYMGNGGSRQSVGSSYARIGSSSVSTQYGPPSGPGARFGGASRPSSQYGAPSRSFGGNGASNGISTQYGAPSSNGLSTQYGAPSAQYAAPSTQYGAPSGSNGGFDAPSTQYGAPSNSFGSSAPSSSYGAPSASSFGRSSSSNGLSSRYGAPRAGSGLSTQYGAPGRQGGGFNRASSPSAQYDAPSTQYGAPSTQYGAPGGYPGGRGYSSATEDPLAEPANYEFQYEVNDADSGSEFQHEESRQDDNAIGSYSVVLPDGRRQIVEYQADQEGFQPRIRYEDTGRGAGGYNYAPGQNNGGPY